MWKRGGDMGKLWIWDGDGLRGVEIRGAGQTEGTDSGIFSSANGLGQDLLLNPGSFTAKVAGIHPGDAVIALSRRPLPMRREWEGIWVLNEGAAMNDFAKPERQQELWRMSGLGVSAKLPDERLFVVTVCNLEPLSITRATNQRNGRAPGDGRLFSEQKASGQKLLISEQEFSGDGRLFSEHEFRAHSRFSRQGEAAAWSSAGPGDWPGDAALRRVARVAVRALYTLRLDAGEALIALAGDGRCAVREARPLLREAAWREAALGRIAAVLGAASSAEGEGRRILLGADPEFALLMPTGKIAPASRFFGAGAGGAAGSDAVLAGRRLLYPVAELRPRPAESPTALARNVRRLMLAAADKVRDPALRWVAGGMPVPGLALGGHIHISGAPLTGRLLRLLDSCAAYPLAMVEDPAGRARRPRYGFLGDFRLQPHGGFEYRTLPSWLVSPAAAKAAFALALLCAREAFSMPRIPASEERYRAAYYAGDATELAGGLDDISAAVSQCGSYPALARYIEPLFESARAGKTWNEQDDFRVKWRIPMPDKPGGTATRATPLPSRSTEIDSIKK